MKKNIQEYVLKGQEIFIGLEDSKKTWKLCVRSKKMIVHETSMPAEYEVLINYLRNKFPECTISVMYESGFSGFGLHDKLDNDGIKCIVTPAHMVTEEKCNRIKNDKIDARRLAKNLENGDYKICHVPDKELREDRQIVRMYSQVQKDITRICNRIRRALEFHGIDKNFKPGAWTRTDYVSAKESINLMDISISLKYSYKKYFNELEFMWDLKKDILNELKRLSNSDRYKDNVRILKSAPGIGMLTAIRLTLEWGDIKRFRRKQSFANFLGLIPSEHSSGDRERKGHITKQGNRMVRACLIESAWVAIRKDPVMFDKFQKVLSNCGSKKKAIVAVARKLAIRMRTLLLTGDEYVLGVIQ